jgi:hypothetical protein
MRVFSVLIGATLLLASVAMAGVNGSVVPFVRAAGEDGVSGSGMGKEGAGVYVEYRVGARGFGGVNAVHVDVEYDPSGLAFEGFTAGDLFEDPLVLGPFDRSDRHVVDVTTATLSGAVSRTSGEVGLLRFRVLDPDRTSVRLVSFQTADGSWEVETQVSYSNAVGLSRLPTATVLHRNVPNPFNPTTEIRFSLSDPGEVRLAVYNVQGQHVRTLASGIWESGTHSVLWDGEDGSGVPVSSGVYFYRFESGKYSKTERMTLVR